MSEIVAMDMGDEIHLIQGKLMVTLKVVKVEDAPDV